MSRFKHAVNSPHTKAWNERIGRIIVNFSALEFESILWLLQLSEQDKKIKIFVETPFSPRVTHVMKHIEDRSLDARWRKSSLHAWNDALKLAKVRNHVAHNPLIFHWTNPVESGEPDYIGIPNFRAPGSGNKEWLLSKARSDKCSDEIVVLVKNLADLRMEWCKNRDQGNVPPVRIEPTRWYKLKRWVARTICERYL